MTADSDMKRPLPVEKQEFLDAVEHHLDDDKIDAVVEAVQDECPTCGAYVLNPALHRDWHQQWRQRMSEVAAEASRYKSPPVYGGRGPM